MKPKSHSADTAATSGLPAAWLARLRQPLTEDRPLQIIHGISRTGSALSGEAQMVPGTTAVGLVDQSMALYRDCGLGGVVCNVAFADYMRSEQNWETLVAGVQTCRKLGMLVWIYDEEGYPSGGAGGLVLQEHPEYEAQELAYDPAQADPFILRPAYEFTHASNNFHAARRYINLIDDRAVRAFIATTHQAYRDRLGDFRDSPVKAFFTDEPSLITVNLGLIPEPARSKVPVTDPIDPTVKPLPVVPWVYDLPERYRERYGEDLIPARRCLFTGGTDADRRTRRQYWSLIADLVADRYFGAIGKWCAAAGVASSGHTLWEENLMHHPTLEGNGLKALSRMDIPGLDVLTSDPEAVFSTYWLTGALPASAAILTGRRRVMTEVSDFCEKMDGPGPAHLPEMQATAAWQAAWGVTDFTLYYSLADRSADDYRNYCDYVGRLNALLKPAALDPDVLLYYPIHDLWEEYRPVAEPLKIDSQTARAQGIVGSFNRLGKALTRSQIPFCLIDHEFLAGAKTATACLRIKGHSFRTLVLPEGAELPAAAQKVVDRFRKQGGRVLCDTPSEPLNSARLADAIRPDYRLTPGTEQVVLGRFVRAGRPLLLLNAGQTAYAGNLVTPHPGKWSRVDPATGAVEVVDAKASSGLAVTLGPRQAMIFVGER